MVPNPKTIRALGTALFVASLSPLLTNCGNGGKAHYSLEPLSTDQAITMLDKSSNDPKKTNIILERMQTNLRSDFSFRRFWRELHQRGIAQRMNPEQIDKLFSLQDQSCKSIDFDEFAKFILEMGRGYEFIVGELRKCQTALTPERARDFLIRMMVTASQNSKNTAAAPAVARETESPPAAQATEQGNMPLVTELSVDDWQIYADMAGVGQGGGKQLTQEQKETIVSKFLSREVLLSPNANWGPVVCFLTEQDYRSVDQELRSHGHADLADRLNTYFFSACGQEM